MANSNTFGNEHKQNRLLYRELFFKANDGLKEQIYPLKDNVICAKCHQCCEIRYSTLSPADIYDLASQGDEVSLEYIKLFLPLGVKADFQYSKEVKVDININNLAAKEKNKEYTELLIEKHQEAVYFYGCRYTKNSENCQKSILCDFPSSIQTILPKDCSYRNWQKLALDKIKSDVSKDIYQKLQDIEKYRQTFTCKRTGCCCKLASSEFSYEELKEKAKKGDKFAIQFTSVFIPYKNIEEVRTLFPEYIDFVNEHLDSDEQVHFYHCPHVTDDNLCSRYEERPQICRDFPNNPLSILPLSCGYREWKDEVMVAAMFMHALIEIVEFQKEKIDFALEC
ncbi:MAG: YkgJ family cysteine cluster protein [bacterium]